jgi:hypothetical protein
LNRISEEYETLIVFLEFSAFLSLCIEARYFVYDAWVRHVAGGVSDGGLDVKRGIFALLAAFALMANVAISPSELSIETDSGSAEAQFASTITFSNRSANLRHFRARVVERMNLEKVADAKIQVFPDQFSARPGDDTTLTVSFQSAGLEESESYFIVIDEIIIEQSDQDANIIAIPFSVFVPVHLSPVGSAAQLNIGHSEDCAKIVVSNAGSRFAFVSDYEIRSGSLALLTSKRITEAFDGDSFIAPGQSRDILLDDPLLECDDLSLKPAE